MQEKYIEHYMATVFHKWFMNICKEVGDTPIRAAIQNHIYFPDPAAPERVRLQSFIKGLIEFYEKIKDLPDPEEPPIVYEGGVSPSALVAMESLRSSRKDLTNT